MSRQITIIILLSISIICSSLAVVESTVRYNKISKYYDIKNSELEKLIKELQARK